MEAHELDYHGELLPFLDGSLSCRHNRGGFVRELNYHLYVVAWRVEVSRLTRLRYLSYCMEWYIAPIA